METKDISQKVSLYRQIGSGLKQVPWQFVRGCIYFAALVAVPIFLPDPNGYTTQAIAEMRRQEDYNCITMQAVECADTNDNGTIEEEEKVMLDARLKSMILEYNTRR